MISGVLQSSLASQLNVLQRNTKLDLFKNAALKIDCGTIEATESSLNCLMVSAPRMSHVQKIQIERASLAALGLLLAVVSDVSTLTLSAMTGVDEIGMQQVAACKGLVMLKLVGCVDVSPIGLHALCQRLPNLNSISCCACPQLTGPGLRRCAELLKGQGKSVDIVDSTWKAL